MKQTSKNPFSVIFGKEPVQVIRRLEETDRILSAFNEEPAFSQVYLITGVRGSGKTVLMTEVSRNLAKKSGWIVIELNPARNLLEDLATKLTSQNAFVRIFDNAKINLSYFGLGLDISGTAAITNLEVALSRMLASLKKHGKKILITVDEVSSTSHMREFAHSYQIFVRQELPVFLLMTGLYENIRAIQDEKSLTFLYRAPRINLGPLSVREIASRYGELFELSPEQGVEMARMTKGYSFAFQVLGYLTWEAGGDYRSVLSEYRRYLEDYSYDKIWSGMSANDKQLAYGIASANSGKVADIRRLLGMDTNHFNPYRKRLIQKGIVNGEEYGYLRFELPYFREYVLDNYEIETCD